MSIRRLDQGQHEHDGVLRTALHTAVDSVEPGADGLDQIRAKVAARQAARRGLGWWTAVWPGDNGSWWRFLLPPRGWLPAVAGAVVARFRPDPNRAGWFGWLRPAAAVATGLFVVTAGSWAVAAMHSALNPPVHVRGPHTSVSPERKIRTSTTSHQPYSTTSGSGGSAPIGQQNGAPGGQPTPSCSPTTSTTQGTSPPVSPSSSGTSSVSVSPSDSSSSTTTPPSSTGTTPAENTPSSSPTAGSYGASPTDSPAPADSPAATGKALLSLDAVAATQFAGTSELAGAGVNHDSPAVSSSPQPTVTPTVSAPATPYPTSNPSPPAPC